MRVRTHILAASALVATAVALPAANSTTATSSSGAASPGEASYVDASIHLDGELLDWAFVDVDADGRDELGLAVRTPRGERELRFHRTTKNSIAGAPYVTIPILEDIIAWSVADVRPELDGREVVFLTRQGAWSFDPRKSGYRGNIAKLCSIDLLFDVPSPRELPYWSYVLQSDAGERLLLPDRSGFRIFGPDPAAGEGDPPWHEIRSYRNQSGYTPPDPADAERRRREAERESNQRTVRLGVTVGDSLRPFIDDAGDTLLQDDFRIQAPALVDIDGDGRRDMLLLDGDRLHVYLATASGLPAKPTRIEPLPAFLEHDGQRAALRLVDIDGDGDLDVLGIWSEEIDSFENVQWRVYVMRSSRDRLLPEKPLQVLRFEAAELRATVTDIDGDKRPDLSVRSFQVPTKMQMVTSTEIEFTYAQLLYLGEKRGGFDRTPVMRKQQTFDEQSVREVFRNRELVLDCSGDGIADLVEVDLQGQVGVRRVTKSSGFFSGTTWNIEDSYWKQYPSRGSVGSLTVTDLNGDGLGDIVSSADSVLTVYISQRR